MGMGSMGIDMGMGSMVKIPNTTIPMDMRARYINLPYPDTQSLKLIGKGLRSEEKREFEEAMEADRAERADLSPQA